MVDLVVAGGLVHLLAVHVLLIRVLGVAQVVLIRHLLPQRQVAAVLVRLVLTERTLRPETVVRVFQYLLLGHRFLTLAVVGEGAIITHPQ